jgi:hypothetical protein
MRKMTLRREVSVMDAMTAMRMKMGEAMGAAKAKMDDVGEVQGSKADKGEDAAEGEVTVTCPKCGAEFEVDGATGKVV